MQNQSLIDYAARFLKKQFPTGADSAEQAAAFAAQLRAGCHQDLVRLIVRITEDLPADLTGKEALHHFGCVIAEGSDINLWGMPDCACGKADCVYCSTGMATTPARLVAG